MSTPETTDVLIVGYGPVGAALACLLGRYGVSTCVIDRSTEIYMAPRAIALDNEALRILQMVGLDEDAFERVPIPHVKMRSPYLGEFGHLNTGGAIDGHPKLVTFYQPDLERALRQEVTNHACVDVQLGVELVDIEDANGIRARVRHPNGQLTQIRARYLVGADGASSLVRKLIGQDFAGRSYAEDWLIVDASGVDKPIDHVEFICDPKRPTPHMVAPGGRTRWEFMLQPGERAEEMESDASLKALLAPWGDPAHMQIERRAVYRFHALCCDAFSRGRVFLAGDAAHVTPPFVGQGLVAGLRDAANLGWKLAWVVNGRADPGLLDSYDQERRPHARKMIALARLMGGLVMPKSRTMAVLVHGGVRLLRQVPGLRSYIDELGVKPKNAFGRGLFVPGRSRLKRGSMLPQVYVRTARREVLLSDEAFGGQWLLLGFGQDPAASIEARRLQQWTAAGGRTASVHQRGSALPAGDSAFEDIEGGLLPSTAPAAWCAVVRPDKTIAHDGPISQAERLLGECLALIHGPQIPETTVHETLKDANPTI